MKEKFMKKIISVILFVALALFSVSVARAELSSGYEDSEKSYRLLQPNSFTISLLDVALAYSVDYDRVLNEYFGLGISGSYIGNSDDFAAGIVNLHANIYPVGGKSFAMLISPGYSITTSDYDVLNFTGGSGFGTVGVGFEYRKTLVLRVKLNFLIGPDDFWFPYPGISLGGAF